MLITGQGTATTSSALLFEQPPGQSVVTVTSSSASTALAYLGASTSSSSSVSTSNGYPLAAGSSVTWATYQGSRGAYVYVVSSGTATVGWVISTDG